MKLQKVFELDSSELGQLEISGLATDTRLIEKGNVFFALQGQQYDGNQFISEAYAKGAVAVVSESDFSHQYAGKAFLQVENIRCVLAQAASKFYVPQPNYIALVTGTSGKTSVVSFLQQIWTATGHPAASIGTVGIHSDVLNKNISLTTPDVVTLHKALQELSLSKIQHVAMEASSHGLDQYRLEGVQCRVAGFTNLGRDHLDYHKTKEIYLDAKMRLFEELLPVGAPAVIFADDPASEIVMSRVKKAGRELLSVGRSGKYIQLKRVEHARYKQEAELLIDNVFYEAELPLAGHFQVNNILVALGMALVSGVEIQDALKALKHLTGAKGRLDLVGFTPSHAPIYVDYAHKPEALENVLNSVRPFTTGRVMLVFGCGGDRDKGKRPIMGEIACRLADVVIVTDDNPRNENPEQIRAEILKTVPNAYEIANRGEAINFAISNLKEGDSLIIAGKGHEEGQIIGNKVVCFSDHEEVKKCLLQLKADKKYG